MYTLLNFETKPNDQVEVFVCHFCCMVKRWVQDHQDHFQTVSISLKKSLAKKSMSFHPKLSLSKTVFLMKFTWSNFSKWFFFLILRMALNVFFWNPQPNKDLKDKNNQSYDVSYVDARLLEQVGLLMQMTVGESQIIEQKISMSVYHNKHSSFFGRCV